MIIITNRKILHRVSKETTQQEVDDLKLVEKIKEANKTAWTKGHGLAAIQIGYPLRFAWFIYNDIETCLLNPKITYGLGSVIQAEGCLSIPGKWTIVKRFFEIEYISHGKKRRAKGTKARIIQHEIDHMDGKLNDESHYKNNSKNNTD